MALYTVRSERLFCEQLDYNFLFRWFLELEVDEAGFDHSIFSRNRTRLLARSPVSSSAPWSSKRAPADCFPTSTSRWTGRWSSPLGVGTPKGFLRLRSGQAPLYLIAMLPTS